MGKYQEAMNAAVDCVKTGQVCIAHCTHLLAKGDKSMKDCFLAAQNMVALSEAMVKVSSLGSHKKLIKKTAKACITACKACMKECKDHMDKHTDCKDCYDSCKACVAACEKLV